MRTSELLYTILNIMLRLVKVCDTTAILGMWDYSLGTPIYLRNLVQEDSFFLKT